jgi:hypothetical protein
MQYRLIPLLFLVLALAPGLSPQAAQTEQASQNGSIVFLVTDVTGGAVQNAEVDIDPLPKALANLRTNKDGMLSVDLPPGMYDLTVKSPGFRTARKHAEIRAGSRETISVVLDVGGCPPGNCVTVTEGPLSPWLSSPLPSSRAVPRDLRIRVLDGRNGHPLTNICLNVSMGIWHGADLLAPTNGEGFIVLDLEGGMVSAEIPPDSHCEGGFPTHAVLPSGEDRITPASGGNDCHPKRQTPTPLWYSIREILEHGVVGENVCGKVRVEARPGELIFFVRPTPWYVRPFR